MTGETLVLPPISPRGGTTVTNGAFAMAHGMRVPNMGSPPAAFKLAPNPLQNERPGNGRLAGFTTGYLYVSYGAPVENLRYQDSGLTKTSLEQKLAPMRSEREKLRLLRRADHCERRAAQEREAEQHRQIQRKHRRMMREYRSKQDERFRAAQLVQFLWRRHYKLSIQLADQFAFQEKQREAAAIKLQNHARIWATRTSHTRGGSLASIMPAYAAFYYPWTAHRHAVKIQCMYRSAVARREAQLLRARLLLFTNAMYFAGLRTGLEIAAATQIAATSRGMFARREMQTIKRYKQLRTNVMVLRACVGIQTIWRGRKARERSRKKKGKTKGTGGHRSDRSGPMHAAR